MYKPDLVPPVNNFLGNVEIMSDESNFLGRNKKSANFET